MSDDRMITIADFERKEVGAGLYYLSMDAGDYEITIEPHITAGFTVGIYAKRDPFISIRKRAVWKYNHPTTKPNARIQQELISRALTEAQYLYYFYVLRKKDVLQPKGGQDITKRV